MTDRVNSIIVVLDEDVRADDPALQRIQSAIEMVKGVAGTSMHVSDAADAVAITRVRADMGAKIVGTLTDVINNVANIVFEGA